MKAARCLLQISSLTLCLLTTNVFAENVQHPYSKLSKDAITQKALLNTQQRPSISHKLSQTVLDRLTNENQYQLNILSTLDKQLSGNKTNNSIFKADKSRLNQLIKTKESNKLTLSSDAQINFLVLRLIDAIYFLDSVKVAAQQTHDILIEMQTIATQAQSGALSNHDRQSYQQMLEAHIQSINYAQHVNLWNGLKFIGGGKIRIRIGDQETESSTLKIDIPAFDPVTLSLSKISVATAQDAVIALITIEADMAILNRVVAATQTPAIDDAEAMLASIPSVLDQDFTLLMQCTDLAIQAVNGTNSSTELDVIDTYFNYYKAALNQTQTYVSLDGPKMLGGGNIYIQMGAEKSDNNNLIIELPTTDVKSFSLDKVDLKTNDDAYKALMMLLDDIQYFVY